MNNLERLRLNVGTRNLSLRCFSVKANNSSWSLPILKDINNKNKGKQFVTRPQNKCSKQFLQDIGSVAQYYGEYILNNATDLVPVKLNEEVQKIKQYDGDMYNQLSQAGYFSGNLSATLKELSDAYLIDYEIQHPVREHDLRRTGNKPPVQTKRERHINMLCAYGFDTDPATLTPVKTWNINKNLMVNPAMDNPAPTARKRLGTWAYKTRTTIYGELLRVLKWAVIEQRITHNPLAGYKESDIPYKVTEKNSPRNKTQKITLLNEQWPIDIIDQMISSCSGSIRYQTLFMISFYTGSRLADYKDLLWSDLEFGRPDIHHEKINRWWIYKKCDRKSVAVERNWIPALQRLSDQIDKYRRFKIDNGGIDLDGRVFDFVTDNHGGWNAQVPREFKQFFTEAGIELGDVDLNGNLLRSSFMDWALNTKGWNVEMVAKYCGTSPKTIQQFYCNNTSQSMRHNNRRILDLEAAEAATTTEQALFNIVRGA